MRAGAACAKVPFLSGPADADRAGNRGVAGTGHGSDARRRARGRDRAPGPRRRAAPDGRRGRAPRPAWRAQRTCSSTCSSARARGRRRGAARGAGRRGRRHDDARAGLDRRRRRARGRPSRRSRHSPASRSARGRRRPISSASAPSCRASSRTRQEERRRIWQLQAEALFGADHPLACPILGTSGVARRDGALDDLAASRPLARGERRAGRGRPGRPGQRRRCGGRRSSRSPRGEPAEPLDETPQPGGRRHEERRSGLLHVAVGWRFGGIDDPRLPALRLAEIVLAHGSGLAALRAAAHAPAAGLPRLDGARALPRRGPPLGRHGLRSPPRHAGGAGDHRRGRAARHAGPAWPELEAARRQLHGSLARAFEVSRRLAGFSATQLLFDRLERIDAFLARIDACEPADVAAAAAALVRSDGGHAISSVGRAPAA